MSLPAPTDCTDAHLEAFRERLIAWFVPRARPMPWRETDDPYRIWVSEIMLQQTRVDQATPYYERFTDAFPTVEALASADRDEVLRLWEGLGYYSRARNLHDAARMVVETFGGAVPDTYDAIRKLPGVGPYTAAAVLSIAFGRPHGVMDGNVKRVLTRVFEIDRRVDRAATKRALQALADHLLPEAQPGTFNEAMMELGATVCTPSSPECAVCPLREVCSARANDTQERYPVTKKRKPVPHHDIAVGLIEDEAGRILIQQRPEEKMLGGLWEFPGGKCEEGEAPADACRREIEEELGLVVEPSAPYAPIDHAYSHFKITLHAYHCRVESGEAQAREGQPLEWVAREELEGYAFPRANRKLLEQLEARRAAPTLFDADH